MFLSRVIILKSDDFCSTSRLKKGRKLVGKFEAGDGNAVRFLYRTIETRRNMRDEPFKGTRNLTHCSTYAKADPHHGQYIPFYSSRVCITLTINF